MKAQYIQIIREYEVKQGFRSEFIDAYKPYGVRDTLLKTCPGYIKTRLVANNEKPGSFITVDNWESYDALLEMEKILADDYKKLETRCSKYFFSKILYAFISLK